MLIIFPSQVVSFEGLLEKRPEEVEVSVIHENYYDYTIIFHASNTPVPKARKGKLALDVRLVRLLFILVH